MRRPLPSLVIDLQLVLGAVFSCSANRLRILIGALVVFLLPAIATAQNAPKNVLIFYADHTSLPANILVNNAIRSTFKEQFKSPIQIYDEGLDSFRIPSEEYESELLNLLKRKYDRVHLDLIFTLGAPPLRFLLKHQGELFTDTPILYLVNDGNRIADLNLESRASGVSSKVEVQPTLDLALRLQPQTQRVVVVGGKAQLDQDLVTLARKEFQPYEGRLEFTYLTELTPEEIRQRLAALPDNTIVIYLAFNRDAAGNSYQSPDVVSLLSSTTRAPIYGHSQTFFGNGIVGGRLMDYEGLGLSVAQMGLRVLGGESVQNMAPQTLPSAGMFDWRQLQRWGIDEAKLPVGTTVRFREYSFWELYKWRIVGAVTLIALQSLLIVGLLLNRTKRRRAEEEVRLSETRFRAMADSFSVMIWIADTNMLCTYFNKKCMDYTGRSLEELCGQGWLESVHEEDAQRCIDIYTAAYARRESFLYEFRLRRADGEYRWVYSTGVPRFAANGDLVGYIGSAVDINDRKLAEETVRESEARFRAMADSSAILIWIADENMLCTYFNKRVLDFTGLSMDQLVGEGWLDIVHEDDRQRCVAGYTAGYERRENFVLEFRLLGADGEYHWIYDTGTPRIASNGELLGYIGSAVDITDRRNAEEALQIAHEEVSKLKNQLEAENIYLQEEIKLAHHVDEIIGESDAIKYVLYKIGQVSQTDTTALILGETGTGKELVARAIHNQSGRKERPLVKVNCAALSASLIESELFGHEKGAFTGATARKMGRFELADGATIFLDEIGELPVELQAKLLRVLQEGEFERLGGTKTIKVDVRILAATNRNLKAEVDKGTFREDLWYRLNVFPLTVPPLRQRKEDIPLMVRHFVQGYSRKVGKTITSISSATHKKLTDYSWPGNVRELSNVIERAVVNAQGPILHIADQFEQPRAEREPDLTRTLEEIEKDYIIRVLESTRWRIGGANGAAFVLGLNSSTLRTRMLKLGIHKTVGTQRSRSKESASI